MRNRIKSFLLLVSAVFILASCSNDDKNVKEYQLTVASVKRIMFNPDHFSPYYAKSDGKNEWGAFSRINGFEHREGTEYVIRIKQEYDKSMEGMIGGSPYSYHLLEIISATEKDSENIPLQEGYILVASKKTGDKDFPYYTNDIMTGGWKKFSDIEGFDGYEEGYEYTLVVDCKYNGSNALQKYNYIYKKMVKKEKIDSAGLPK